MGEEVITGDVQNIILGYLMGDDDVEIYESEDGKRLVIDSGSERTLYRRSFSIESTPDVDYAHLATVTKDTGSHTNSSFSATVYGAKDVGQEQARTITVHGGVRNDAYDFVYDRFGSGVSESDSADVVITRSTSDFHLYVRKPSYAKPKAVIEATEDFGKYDFQQGLAEGELVGDIIYDTANEESDITHRGHDHSGDELRPKDVTLKVQDEAGEEALINIGKQATEKTTTGNLYGADVRMDASTTDDVRGFTSVTSQSGDGGRNIGGRAYVYSDGPSHNQSIGYYARIVQKSGSDGALPPSAGLYIDSRNSDYRPFGAILDDSASIWKHGIVLNGDYSDTLVRHPNFKILPNGNIETDGTITQQGDKQPRLRELHRGVPPSGSTETFNLNTVLPRDNSSWMVHISSSMDRSDYTNRGFEGQFRYYSGYDSNGDNFERVTNIIQPTAFGSQHSLSHDGSGTLSYSGGTVNYRAEIVVEARRLG